MCDKLKQMHAKALEGKVDKCMGLLVFILGIFYPGAGAWLVAILNCDKGQDFWLNCLIVGWLQAFFSVFGGWCWAIWYGWQVYQKSK